jgi:hypothetical protein
MNGLKIAVPLLIAVSVTLGPAFLPGSPQKALAAQVKPDPAATPREPDPLVKPATARKPEPAKPAKTAKRKPAKPARRRPVKAVKRKPAKRAHDKTVRAVKHKRAKPAKPRKLAKPATKRSARRGRKSAASGKAGGQFLLCRHDSSVRVHGQDRTYLVNNNNFMGLAECLSGSAHAPAFRVARSGATSTGPDSDAFPDIYTGCSWGRCSPGAKLPARVSDLGNPVTTWDTTENAGGLWAASYDMWFDPRPIRTGQAGAEMMIWLNVRGLYNAAGEGWPVVRIDGALWYVLTWITGNGHQQWRYVQFRKYTPRWNVTGLSLKPFYQYMENQGWITPSWYALNVEAGFEIWSGGTGLTTTAFSAT